MQGSLSYWAFAVLCRGIVFVVFIPLGHLLVWVSAALAGLFIVLFAVYPGFHIGLCPHSTLGYAGVPPFQGSLSDWAFAVLCRGIVFVKCAWVCKWIVAFVCVFV